MPSCAGIPTRWEQPSVALKGKGDFSRISLQAAELADIYQGMALDNIREMFATDNGGLSLDDLSFEDFTKRFLEANENGTRDEFEAELAALVGPLLDQVFAPPQQQPAPEGAQ